MRVVVLLSLTCCLAFVGAPFVQAATLQAQASTAQTMLNQANPGDTVVLGDGTYRGNLTMRRSGTASAPITIHAASRQGAVLQDALLTLAGNYVVVKGLVFANGQVTISGDRNRVTRNWFKDGRPGGNQSRLSSAVMITGGAYNLVDFNEVKNWQRRGLRVRDLKNSTKGNRFVRNHLVDFRRSDPKANSGDALQSGANSTDSAYCAETLFEHNLLERVNADGEIVSIKSSCNTVRQNTFLDSQGVVNNRHGDHNRWVGNWLQDVKALVIYGDHNHVLGNRLVNAHLLIRNGDTTSDGMTLRGESGHPAAQHSLVACNTITGLGRYLGIGMRIPGGGASSGKPARDTVLANNQVPVVRTGQHTGTTQGTYDCRTLPSPVKLTAAQVGPDAPEADAPPPPPDPPVVPPPPGPPAPPALVGSIEAEMLTLTPPMVVSTDPQASGGASVWVPTGEGDSFADATMGGPGEARLVILVASPGTYRLWARTWAADGGSDSFYVTLNGALVLAWNNIPQAWQWNTVADVALTAGLHMLAFRQREAGARLDSLLLTPDLTWQPCEGDAC